MVNPRFVIKAVISGQRLNINVPLTVSGTVNYIGVEAKCTSEWNGCTIVGYILQPSTGYYAQMALIYDQEKDLYYFPNAERLTLSAGEWDIWFVGIIAENGQEKYRVTTETRVFTVYANEFEKRLPQGNITLDEEAIARATDAQNKANLVLDLYNAGKLTGPKGDPGDPAEIGFVQASVDNTTGNPGCVVTVTENPENTYNMQFAFSGIKGAKGDTGDTGPKGDTGAQGAPGRDGTDGRDGVDGETIDDYVLVQAEQPTSETNKMWLKPTASGDPIMIPSAEEFQELNNAITVTKTGVPADFTNNYLTSGGNESPSAKLILSKRYFNYQQDKLISIETYSPYGIYVYGFKRATYIGSLRENGTFSTASPSPMLYADKINLADYPDITFKFSLRHNVNGSPVDISTDEAVNLKFTFEVNRELARRKISVIGDSISTFTGYISPGATSAYYPSNLARMYYVENMYWKTLALRNDMEIEVIDAYGGSTVADKWQTSTRVPFYDDSRVNRLGSPDVIIVEGGINDFGGNPLGDYPPLGDYTKTYEFRTGYSLLLNKLKQKYKNATIICLSMATPHSYNNTTFPEKQTKVVQALATDKTPHAFAEFNESIEHIAKQYQCAYCDITDLVNYYTNPTSSLEAHWYFNVHQDVAYRIEQTLKKIFA